MRTILILLLTTAALSATDVPPRPTDGDWTLTSFTDGTGAAEMTVTATLDGLAIRGRGPVNSWFGTLVVTADGLAPGDQPFGSTMMASLPERMALEQRFQRALGGVTTINRADGQLVMTGDGIALRWARAP